MDNLADPSLLISTSTAKAIEHTSLERRLNASVDVKEERGIRVVSVSPRDVPWFMITIHHKRLEDAMEMIEDALTFIRELEANPKDQSLIALGRIMEGKRVEVSKEFWPKVRTEIQIQAGKWIDDKQDVYAMIALEEVKRLDALFGSGMSTQ